MQGEVAVSMSRPHLTSLRCGTVTPCIPGGASGCDHSLGHHNLGSQLQTWAQCPAWCEHHLCQGKAGRGFSPQRFSPCVLTIHSERKQVEKSTPAIPVMWVLLEEESGSACCFLIGHDLYQIQIKNRKSFLRLHNIYHTFKYCTTVKAELTNLKEEELINIKDNFRTSKNFYKTMRTKSSENLIRVAYATDCANMKLNCFKNYIQIQYNTAIKKAYL